MELFEGKNIRLVWDNTSQKHWFSVVDVCAALRDCDYNTARNYWKWLKNKLANKGGQGSQLVSVTNQLKLQAMDGKLRFTDVMDIHEVLQLIQICPSPKADAFRMWISEIADVSSDVVKTLEKAIIGAKDKVRFKVVGLLMTIRRKKYVLFEDEKIPFICAKSEINLGIAA